MDDYVSLWIAEHHISHHEPRFVLGREMRPPIFTLFWVNPIFFYYTVVEEFFLPLSNFEVIPTLVYALLTVSGDHRIIKYIAKNSEKTKYLLTR